MLLYLVGRSGAGTAGYTADNVRAWKQYQAGTRTYFLTFGAEGLVSRHTASGSVFYTFDSQGSVCQRLDGAANVLNTSDFDAFGSQLSGPVGADPWGYGAQSGYYTDAETGLLLLGLRYYDPALGTFLNRDPIRYRGGINLYAYVANRPTFDHDPTGLMYPGGKGPGGIKPPAYLEPWNPPDPPVPACDRPVGNAGWDQLPWWRKALLWIGGYDPASEARIAERGRDVWREGHGVSVEKGPTRMRLPPEQTSCPLPEPGTPPALPPGGVVGGDSGGGGEGGGLGGFINEPGGEGGACFVAGIPVEMADGTLRSIDSVRVGDKVRSRDEHSGELSSKPVVRIFAHTTNAVVEITLSDGERVETTPEHRLFVAGHGFLRASQLQPGLALYSSGGRSINVAAVRAEQVKPVRVYNLEIAEWHTYFVGRSRLWVHNMK